jgi:hypothetical protein
MEEPMKKLAAISLAAVILLLATATPSMAGRGYWRGGGRVFVGVGVGPYWGWGGYPYWGYPYYYPPPYYSYGPPTVVVQQPPTYIQQDVQPEEAAPAPQAYWYYCSSSRAYYPSVQTCAETWIKVPPRQE